MNKELEILENYIMQNYAGLKIDYMQSDHTEPYFRYESTCRTILDKNISTSSLLCYSVTGKTREDALKQLCKSLSKNHGGIKIFEEIYNV